jgi:hypothetical protein
MAWTIVDYTNGKNGGYLQLCKDGVRVADFFPYAAKGPGELWIREQAKHIASVLNAAEVSSCHDGSQ